MNKLTSFSFLLLLISFSLNSLSSAQNKKANFELAERFTTQKMQKMVGSTSVFPRWIDDTNNFWYTYENSEGKSGISLMVNEEISACFSTRKKWLLNYLRVLAELLMPKIWT